MIEDLKKWIELIHAGVYLAKGRLGNAKRAAWLLRQIEELENQLEQDYKSYQPVDERAIKELRLSRDTIWYHARMAGPLFQIHLKQRELKNK